MQKFFLKGNVGKDPEVKTFDNGGKVVTFSVADTERGYKTKEGKEIPERTEWFRCVVRQSGLCGIVEQYVKKGTLVVLWGKVHTREFENKDGQKEKIVEVYVDELDFTSNKSESQTQQQPKVENTSAPAETKNDDLPF